MGICGLVRNFFGSSGNSNELSDSNEVSIEEVPQTPQYETTQYSLHSMPGTSVEVLASDYTLAEQMISYFLTSSENQDDSNPFDEFPILNDDTGILRDMTALTRQFQDGQVASFRDRAFLQVCQYGAIQVGANDILENVINAYNQVSNSYST